MKITGHIYEVTNLVEFTTSYLINPKKPKPGTFKSAPGLHVHLGSIIEGILPSFIPSLSAETVSGADGKFSLNISDSLLKQLQINRMAYFTAFRKTGSIDVLGTSVPIFEAVYRSSAFDIITFKGEETDIYFAPYNVSNNSGISQKQVDDQIKESKGKFKDLEKLSGSIQNGHVSVSGSGRGADIKFNIDLSTSTSFILSEFIRGKVKDMNIDLPGPDWLVELCVSKDDIQKEIEKGIAKLMGDVNVKIEKEVIAQIAKETDQDPDDVKAIFKKTASITFTKLNYPVVEQKIIKVPYGGQLLVDIRAVVPKLAIGFPRLIG